MKPLIKKLVPRFLLAWYYQLFALAGAIIFWFPSRDIYVIGVTGTNGKTSTVHLISHILEEAGYGVASVSSVRFKIGSNIEKNMLKMTMPGRFLLQRFFRNAVNAKCKYAVIEVTSEGILQRRHKYIDFDVAVFTNLTPEHIEVHGSFEAYKRAKGELFASCGNIHIINEKDPNAEYFLKFPAKKIMRYRGEFMQANTEAAKLVCRSQGIDEGIITKAILSFPGVPGRMEVVAKQPFKVIVDYAHTPDALEKVYREIGNSRMVCVLGSAGGGRDKWKRPKMGQIADKYCDEIILTDEDPYQEDPSQIIEDVALGISNHEVSKIVDRREAIKTALSRGKSGDVIIITGKGSEPLMMTKDGPVPWSDKKIVNEELHHAKHRSI